MDNKLPIVQYNPTPAGTKKPKYKDNPTEIAMVIIWLALLCSACNTFTLFWIWHISHAEIAAAASMNQVRWPQPDAQGEAQRIREFLGARMDFLNRLWLEEAPYYNVLVIPDVSTGTVCHMVAPGETIPR